MADDQEKTEVFHFSNEKGTCPFFYANRYGTKEKSSLKYQKTKLFKNEKKIKTEKLLQTK